MLITVSVLATAYVLIHFFSGTMDLFRTIETIGRLIFPIILAILVYGHVARLDEAGILNVTVGIVVISVIDLSGVVLHIITERDISNIYNLKDKNLVFQNTNYTAFLLYCALVARLSFGLAKYWTGVGFISFLILLTFSRSYWAALLISIVLKLTVTPNGKILAVFFAFVSLLPMSTMFQDIDTGWIRENIDSSLATKVEIFLYSARVLISDISIGFWGLGPKSTIDEFIITHSGHSLVGMLPELGALYLAYVFLFTYFLWRGGTYARLHFPGTMLLLLSTFPVSNIALHLVFLLLSVRQQNDQ
ncbi:hypothetical protein [Boseongicola aestuarii]|uniref:Uncharacterized protein n=1 Tax=Boseongicola aestuarii TaxID=1470561 RepID=A0A238IYR5_9RHOB|nr:hypothetical protein [Boseongicola aestuarii]SMX23628.1 hypothetical protein BOA8489_01738 [Boseongicola aestuarii]